MSFQTKVRAARVSAPSPNATAGSWWHRFVKIVYTSTARFSITIGRHGKLTVQMVYPNWGYQLAHQMTGPATSLWNRRHLWIRRWVQERWRIPDAGISTPPLSKRYQAFDFAPNIHHHQRLIRTEDHRALYDAPRHATWISLWHPSTPHRMRPGSGQSGVAVSLRLFLFVYWLDSHVCWGLIHSLQ